MTRYEQGFLTKCAEYNVPAQIAGAMLKQATRVDGGYRLARGAARSFLRNGTSKFNPYAIVEHAAPSPGKLPKAMGIAEHMDALRAVKDRIASMLAEYNPAAEKYLGRVNAGQGVGRRVRLSPRQRLKLRKRIRSGTDVQRAIRESFLNDPARFLETHAGLAPKGHPLTKEMNTLSELINGNRGFTGRRLTQGMYGHPIEGINDLPQSVIMDQSRFWGRS